MNLYKHQQEILDRNPARHLIAFGTGTGKTRTAIELSKKNNVVPLIIVPKALKTNWVNACSTWGLPNFLIVTKEEFRRDWDELGGYDAIIVDEFHNFANIKSQMSKALLKYQRKWKPTYFWGLSATPFLSSPMNIFALATHLGHNWNYWQFRQRFFTDVRMGARVVPVIRKGIEPEIAKLVNTIGTTARLEDLVDVPDQSFEVEYFDLNKGQEKAIKDIDDINYIVRWTKIHQVMGGTLKGNEYEEDKIIGSNKLDRLKELVIENPKTIIVCRYNNEIKVIKDMLECLIDRVEVINGAVKDKHSVLEGLKDTDKYCLIVSAACSDGWELPDCPIMIFYSLDFSLKSRIQMIGRIQRINAVKKNVYVDLVVRGSIDEDVYKTLESKMDFHLELYKGVV